MSGYCEINNIVHFHHNEFPEWFSHISKDGHKHMISTYYNAIIRLKVKNEVIDRLLTFRRGSPVLFTGDKVQYYENDVNSQQTDSTSWH